MTDEHVQAVCRQILEEVHCLKILHFCKMGNHKYTTLSEQFQNQMADLS